MDRFHMAAPAILAGTLIAVVSSDVWAQAGAVQILDFRREMITIYGAPNGPELERVPRAAFSLPLRVHRRDGDFLLVDHNGRQVWLDELQVTLARLTQAACAESGTPRSLPASRQADAVHAVRGAGKSCP
jgi:hypothetical protein